MTKRRYRAIRAGEKCIDCGAIATEMDHRDYNRPHDTDPVCHPCNQKRGAGIPEFPRGARRRQWQLVWVRKTEMTLIWQARNHARKAADLCSESYLRVIERYGSEAEAARQLRLPQSTINGWSRNGVPHYRQAQVEAATNGKLRADKRRYNGQSAR